MSLKLIHIVFILLSMALAFGFGVWALDQQLIAWGVGSLVAGIGLVFYLFWFIQKIRNTSS